MKRLPFELVEIQLQKIYNYKETDLMRIDEMCDTAYEFILASGWSIEDYVYRLLFGEKNN